jgi:threonine dehydratase
MSGIVKADVVRPQLSRADILRAQRQLNGRVIRTPVIRSDELDQLRSAAFGPRERT